MTSHPPYGIEGFAGEATTDTIYEASRLRDEDIVDATMAATLGSHHALKDDVVALRKAVDAAVARMPGEFATALRATRRLGPVRFESRDSRRFKLVALFRADARYVTAEMTFLASKFTLRIEPVGRRYRGAIVAIDATRDAVLQALGLLARDWQAYLSEAAATKREINPTRVTYGELAGEV